jgi:hypothetical protein
MKIVLYILLGIGITLIIGYSIAYHKLIKLQEAGYADMATVNFKESPRYFSDSLKMPDDKFWRLINLSKAKEPINFSSQITFLIDTLSTLSDHDIVGFECTFKEKVIQLWDYKVKSLYQIVEGDYMSTDDFIYFRCYLISLGKENFETALNHTDDFTVEIDRSQWSGEQLMTVADFAYEKKHDTVAEEQLPRNVAMEVNYDFGNYKMTGEYIALDDFNIRFPKLTSLY